jgi:uncharacterized protein
MSTSPDLPRAVEPLLRHLVSELRVSVIHGPRQSGKSTVLRRLHQELGGVYVTLDDEQQREAVVADPVGLARSGPLLMIDEVQRGGDRLLLAIKAAVDARPDNRVVLTGSTNFLTLPTLSESLAGRAGLVQLWPFSEGELAGRPETFLQQAFDQPRTLADVSTDPWPRGRYWEAMVRGGFPEPAALTSRVARDAWFDGYLTTVTLRDLGQVADVRRPQDLLRLMRYCAASTAREVVKAKWGPALGIERHRLAAYLGLLETAYLVSDVPSWSTDAGRRVRRHPKLMAVDSGLVSHAIGVDEATLAAVVSPTRGQLVETFAHSQLQRACAWSPLRVSISHWRDAFGREVDLVLEATDGRVVGIEVKAAAAATNSDTTGLRALADLVGPRFVHGFVLHLGDATTRFGADITALPLSTLWAG